MTEIKESNMRTNETAGKMDRSTLGNWVKVMGVTLWTDTGVLSGLGMEPSGLRMGDRSPLWDDNLHGMIVRGWNLHGMIVRGWSPCVCISHKQHGCGYNGQ